MFDVDYYYYRLSVLMSKFDAIRASGDMMPTAMGTPALDGKKFSKFFSLTILFIWSKILESFRGRENIINVELKAIIFLLKSVHFLEVFFFVQTKRKKMKKKILLKRLNSNCKIDYLILDGVSKMDSLGHLQFQKKKIKWENFLSTKYF